MWASWAKSPARIHSRTPSFTAFDYVTGDSPPSPSPPPRTPFIHNHSVSFKDVETLFNHNYPPLSPLHKHSLSFKSDELARCPTPHNRHISFKDVQALLTSSESAGPTRKPSIFHRVRSWARRQPPDAQNRVVIYYTSLHVVRKTFNDCRAVRSILKAYRVKTDDRDLSMDGAFLDELQKIMGKKEKDISLPRVFVNGVYVGGAEEIRRLHESGDLKQLIGGVPPTEGGVCSGCGGFRYVVCERCDGSHRVYREKVGQFKSCSSCNENGLIRCPSCTSVVF